MDPLSIAASAIAILQLTQSIIIGTNNFYKSARDCPAEIRGLLDELTSFEKVLESLHLMVDTANGIDVSKRLAGVRKRAGVQVRNCPEHDSSACGTGTLISLQLSQYMVYFFAFI